MTDLAEDQFRRFEMLRLGFEVPAVLRGNASRHEREHERRPVVATLERRLRLGRELLAALVVALTPCVLRGRDERARPLSFVAALRTAQHVVEPAATLGQVATVRPVEQAGGGRELQLELDLAAFARPRECSPDVVVLFVFGLPRAEQRSHQAPIGSALEPVRVPARVPLV